MYRGKKVEDELLNVVGWEQDFNPRLQVLGKLTESESGLTYQAAHPMCQLGMVNALIPPDWDRNIVAWDAGETVKAGDIRKYEGYYWKAKVENTGQTPPAENFHGDYSEDYGDDYWSVTNLLSEKVEQLTRRGIQNAVQKWMTTKNVTKESRTLLERRAAFDGAGRLQNTIQNQDKIVGLEIVPVRGLGVTTKIEKVGLQFNGAGKVTLMLFHSSQSAPVYTETCHYDRTNGSFMWVDMKDWVMPYDGPSGVGGAWYLVYCQSDNEPDDGILMEAVRYEKDWSKEPNCYTCNPYNVQAWRELMQYVKLQPFQVSKPGDWNAESPQLWDIADNLPMLYTNYGLNVMLSVECDVTDLIIKNKIQFAGVIQKQVAYEVLKAAETNPDVVVSRFQANLSHSDVRYELDGSVTTYKRGLGAELDKAYAALQVSTEGIDKICLGCNNHGVRYRTA